MSKTAISYLCTPNHKQILAQENAEVQPGDDDEHICLVHLLVSENNQFACFFAQGNACSTFDLGSVP